jgi:hypothetical protein
MALTQFWPSIKSTGLVAQPSKDGHQSQPDTMADYLALGAIRLVKYFPGDASSQIFMVGDRGQQPYPNPLLSLGESRQWIRTELRDHPTHPHHASLRVYALPEDVNRGSRSKLKDLRKVFKLLADFVDMSPKAWEGNFEAASPIRTYRAPVPTQEESLFYIFNTLTSPKPSLDGAGSCLHSQQSMADIMGDGIYGLKTHLYPYQKRAVAAMLQKEANPAKSLDPRKPMFRDFEGKQFYFDALEGVLLRSPHFYSEPQGGILAETMGYGKTLMCIALILATKGHYPEVPEGRLDACVNAKSERTASLLELAAKTAKRTGTPWKAQFAMLEDEGYRFGRCLDALSKYDAEYIQPVFHPTTPNRQGKKREDFRILRLCYTTLLIVPSNLLVQWKQEIAKHTDENALDLLVLDSSTKKIPHYRTLMKYDMVMITKARFDQEYRDDDLNQGKRMHGQDKFRSQLTEVRWLRVICDEGHSFAGSSYRTHAMAMLDKMSIERRWVVSGTPAHSLHGVEVNLALDEGNQDGEELSSRRTNSIRTALELRKRKDPALEEVKDMEQLRVIVVKFLKVQPWANTKGADHADWRKYLAPFDSSGRRCFAPALRAILQSLIVRHRIEDIDLDLCLPPLYNTTVYLDPSYYDKLSMNLFRVVLTSNAVTSERVDEDYMFHPKNRKFLDALIENLRHSSFHWVGFPQHEVAETLRVSTSYLDSHIDTVSDDDGRLLTEAIMNAERALKDPGWCAFSLLHEIGVYVEDFPEQAAQAWALHGQHTNPLLLGTVQAREVQQHVLKRLDTDDPAAGLTGAGLRAMMTARTQATEAQQIRTNRAHAQQANGKPSPLTAGAGGDPKVKSLRSPSALLFPTETRGLDVVLPSGVKRHLGATSSSGSGSIHVPLPLSLAKAKIVGFTSAKLNYLCSRILALHETEKIIIFYDSNNMAFWIAEALELLGVKFLIYANTLTVNNRASYLAIFNSSDVYRVLLMDLKQASHGLHVACASRVFIVSPIWQPGVEAQAIKRAHRIGQTRPVYVETLVLRGTLEEKILERRKQMTNAELVKAQKSLLDDGTMNGIIRAEGFLSIAGEEDDHNQATRGARLDKPVPLFVQGGEEQEDAAARGNKGQEQDGHDLVTGHKKRKMDHKGKSVRVGFIDPGSWTQTSSAANSSARSSPTLGEQASTTETVVHSTDKPDKKKSVRIVVEDGHVEP